MLQLQRLTHFQQSLIISHGLALSSDHSKLASTLTILLHPVSVTSHSCPPEQNLTLTDKKITAKDRATQLADVSHQSRSQLFFTVCNTIVEYKRISSVHIFPPRRISETV